MTCTRKNRGQRRAAAIVEFAVISIVLFVFMFAIFEYGRYLMVRQIVENAARAGARQAVVVATSTVSSTTANSTVQTAVTQNLAAQNLKNLTVQIYQASATGTNTGTWTTATFGTNIVVQIDGDLPLLFPKLDFIPLVKSTFSFLPNSGAATNSVHITAMCMMHMEAN